MYIMLMNSAGSQDVASMPVIETHLIKDLERGFRRRTADRGAMERGVITATGRRGPFAPPCGLCEMPTLCSTCALTTDGAAGSVPYGLVATPALQTHLRALMLHWICVRCVWSTEWRTWRLYRLHSPKQLALTRRLKAECRCALSRTAPKKIAKDCCPSTKLLCRRAKERRRTCRKRRRSGSEGWGR